MKEALHSYLDKRDFGQTPEPADPGQPSPLGLRYSVQAHRARRLHWDLRLEWDGVLLSWAVPRGPSLDPADKRLAVRTEDHPLSYLQFEGVIPQGNYGAGTVMLWDLGWWQPLQPAAAGLRKGHLRFRLHGRRLTGEWNLVRIADRDRGPGPKDTKDRENWLLIKARDAAADQPDPVARHSRSIATGRDFDEIARGAPPPFPIPRRRAARSRRAAAGHADQPAGRPAQPLARTEAGRLSRADCPGPRRAGGAHPQRAGLDRALWLAAAGV